jgi:hypothetical protein
MALHISLRNFTVGIFVCVLVLIAPLGAQKTIVEQEDGVAVVYNPKMPISIPDYPSNLVFTEDLCIGVESGDENYMFSELFTLEVDDEGDIFVVDTKEECIKVFDRNGQYIRRIGKKGQGPGEIQRFGRIFLFGKLVAINDTGNNRLSFFAKNGDYVKHVPFGKYRSPDARLDSRGYVYEFVLNFDDGPVGELVKLDTDFKLISKITSIKLPTQVPPAELMERIYFRVKDNDSLVWVRTLKYELNIVDKDGNLIKRIMKEHDPIKVTVDRLKKEAKKRYPNRPIPEDFSIPSHFPKYFPIFYYFIFDDEGRIFVCNYYREGDAYIYDVFDSEGRYFLKFTLPENEMLAVIKNGKAYTMIKENEDGIPQVKRYKVTWNY